MQVDDRQIIIRAGVTVAVELPKSDEGVDLSEGPLTVGSIVNAVALPGATFELAIAGILK